MNWKEISEKYPKAFKLLEHWGNYPAVLSRQKKRLLYDFFDSQKIFINIWMSTYDKDSMLISWSIYQIINGLVATGGEYYDNRVDLEKEAFEVAFEILEKELA